MRRIAILAKQFWGFPVTSFEANQPGFLASAILGVRTFSDHSGFVFFFILRSGFINFIKVIMNVKNLSFRTANK